MTEEQLNDLCIAKGNEIAEICSDWNAHDRIPKEIIAVILIGSLAAWLKLCNFPRENAHTALDSALDDIEQ